MTILNIKVPKDTRVKLAPCMSRKVELKTIKLAGMGTMICSRIHPKKTAQETLVTIKDSRLLVIVDNIYVSMTLYLFRN